MCGGTCLSAAVLLGDMGLSPRVRGNRQRRQSYRPATRSIPACAGEPRSFCAILRASGVYPRVCGGTYVATVGPPPKTGLSPRVRGNPAVLLAALLGGRSIPACAGEPWRKRFAAGLALVYPRVCGGTRACGSASILGKGLSPRVRGNPAVLLAALLGGRSIPACAGEPWRKRFAAGLALVYPRVCGGTPYDTDDNRNANGLSPRVRGNRRRQHRSGRQKRSIPACAGEPRLEVKSDG